MSIIQWLFLLPHKKIALLVYWSNLYMFYKFKYQIGQKKKKGTQLGKKVKFRYQMQAGG